MLFWIYPRDADVCVLLQVVKPYYKGCQLYYIQLNF